MSDKDGKIGDGQFKKRAHRPWKSSLLETTIKESGADVNDEVFEFSLDLSNRSSFNFLDEEITATDQEISQSLNEKFSQLQAISIADEKSALIASPNQELKSAIQETMQQQTTIKKQLADKSNNVLSLGGFFQPQQLAPQTDSYNGRKINYLISDLKNKEQELSSLTSNLKITEAIERAEQAELNRKAEEHARLAAEKRMRQAIEQAQQTAEQIRHALEQANQAAIAQREEERLRKLAEEQIKDAKMRATGAELALQNERNARNLAEKEAAEQINRLEKDAAEQINRLEQARRNEEIRRQEAEIHSDALQRELQKKDAEYKESFNKIISLENTIKELTSKQLYNEQKIAELSAQREKLKSIISAEQELRKVAEKRAQEATAKAEEAEKARFAEEQQRKMIDERAKRAVEHASRTVMHLLNAPGSTDYSLHIPTDVTSNMPANPKPPTSAPEKVRIRTEASFNKIAEAEDDDYSF